MTAGATILIIDDDDQMRRFLRNVLAHHGYTLLEAANVATGIELVTRNRPNVVLLDCGSSERPLNAIFMRSL